MSSYTDVSLYYFIDEDSPVLHSGIVLKYEDSSKKKVQAKFYFRPETTIKINNCEDLPQLSYVSNIHVHDLEVLDHIIMSTEKHYGPSFVCWDWTKSAFNGIFDIYFEGNKDPFRIGAEYKLNNALAKHKNLIRDNLYMESFNRL